MTAPQPLSCCKKLASSNTLPVPPSQGAKPNIPKGLVFVVLLLALFSSLPILYVVLRAQDAGWALSWSLLWRPRIGELLINTLKLAAGVTTLSCLIGVSTAWLVERSNLSHGKVWNALVTLPFAVPAFISAYSWISVFPRLEGYYGAVLVLTFSNFPLVHLPVAAALRGMDPALEETSRSLGYGPVATFFKVVLPQLRVAILGGAILIALHMLAEFGALSFLNYETFTTAIFDQYYVAFNSAAAAMMTLVLLVLCTGFLWLEFRLRGHGHYATHRKGAPGEIRPLALGPWKPLAILFLVLLVIMAAGAPLGIISYWLWVGRSAALDLPDLLHTLQITLSFGLSGSVLAVLCALPLVFLAVRHQGRFATLADRLPYFIHSLPGIVVGLTLVFFAVRYAYALYQTVPLLLLGYALLFLPMAQSAIRAALVQVSKQLEEVAYSLGKRGLSVFMRITLPLIAPGVGAGLALVFLQIMKELTATLLLRPSGVETLATKVWELTDNAQFAASAPYAAVLILISGLPVYVLTMRSFTRSSQQVKV